MAKSVQELMTSNPCSIDSDKSVAYAAKMMRDENVGLAPIVEGNRLMREFCQDPTGFVEGAIEGA